jgi:tetratricopeptide (TPR) repeat protein
MTTVGGLILLGGLLYVEEDWRGRHDWERYKQQMEAQGERLDWTNYIPPRIPDNQNFALSPVVASVYQNYLDAQGHEIKPPRTNVVNRLQMSLLHNGDTWNYSSLYSRDRITFSGRWEEAKWTDLKGWQAYYRNPPSPPWAMPVGRMGRYPMRNQIGFMAKPIAAFTNDFPTPTKPGNPAEDVLFALSRFDGTIRDLEIAATNFPDSRFPKDYSHPELITAMTRALVPVSRVLELRAVARLAKNDTEAALSDILLSFRLANSLSNEPLYHSQEGQISVFESALQPIWEGLAAGKWSEAQLFRLQKELEKIDFIAAYTNVVRAERARALAKLDLLRQIRPPRPSASECDEGLSPYFVYFYFDNIPDGWFYQGERSLSEAVTGQILPLLDSTTRTISKNKRGTPVIFNKTDASDTPYDYSGIFLLHPYARLMDIFLPSISSGKYAYAQACADLARLACALERYRKVNGNYPKTLAALTPRFIDRMPCDIIDGAPLRYRLLNDGKFVLYSLGWAYQDDGGKLKRGREPLVDVRNGEWVWTYANN